jgi:hypothetical protein
VKIQKVSATTLISLIVVVFTLAGCEKEGLAGQAGENIDETVEEMQEKAQEAGEKATDKMEATTDAMQEAADSATQ